MNSTIKNTNDYTGKTLTIKYYPSANKSTYKLFDDDGITNNTLSKGKYELINFEGKTREDKTDIIISSSKMQKGNSKKIKLVFPKNNKIALVKINGKYFKNNVDLNSHNNFIEVKFSGKTLNLEIKFKKLNNYIITLLFKQAQKINDSLSIPVIDQHFLFLTLQS